MRGFIFRALVWQTSTDLLLDFTVILSLIVRAIKKKKNGIETFPHVIEDVIQFALTNKVLKSCEIKLQAAFYRGFQNFVVDLNFLRDCTDTLVMGLHIRNISTVN